MEINKELIKYIDNISEFSVCTKDIIPPFLFTLNECMTVLTESNLKVDDSHLFKINVVLDYLHDELNTGHWSNIPIITRQAFTVSSFLKSSSVMFVRNRLFTNVLWKRKCIYLAGNMFQAIILLKINNENPEIVPEVLKCIDLGLLLGAPLNENSELLVKTAAYLTQIINKSKSNQIPNENTRKRKYAFTENSSYYEQIPGKEIHCLSCPSIELFNKDYFVPQVPVKLTDCIDHWPAMKKWLDINYLLQVAGNRTVPVEIGSHYADENWSQKLMTLQDLIKNHFLSDSPTEKLGYLAQHNLFDQITELRDDICIPDYCCLSKKDDDGSEPDINAWFGPQNTVSPLHYDPKNNLLAQVFGTKQIILFAPTDSEYLYPHDDKLLQNTAQVNPLEPNLEKFPLFKKSIMYKCLLKPGEMLYMPEKWWHHVTALDKSFSVSFWWE